MASLPSPLSSAPKPCYGAWRPRRSIFELHTSACIHASYGSSQCASSSKVSVTATIISDDRCKREPTIHPIQDGPLAASILGHI